MSSPGTAEATGADAYRQVLAVPGMAPLYLVGVLARLPHVGGGLALTLYVVEGLGLTYLRAGLVAAALTVGIAAGSPWRGRLVDRVGLRRALVPSILAMPVLWTVLSVSTYWVMLPVALLAGALAVPVFTVIRQAIGVIVPERSRRAAFALDSVLVEASFVIGPPLVVLVILQLGPQPALISIGVGGALSGLLLVWLDPQLRSAGSDHDADPTAVSTRTADDDRPLARRRFGRPGWMTPGLLAMYACAFGTTFVLAGSEVGIIALLREWDRTALVGWAFAVWGAASAVGGLVYGGLRRGASSPLVLLVWLALTTLPLAFATDPLLLLVLLVPAGVLVAPTLSASADGTSRRTGERHRGEAMGWHGTATTAGFSLGAPLAGAAADLFGPWSAFLLVAAVSSVLSLTGLRLVRRHRGRVTAG